MSTIAVGIYLQPLHFLRQHDIISLKFKFASIMITSQSMLARLPQQIFSECSSRDGIIFENQATL